MLPSRASCWAACVCRPGSLDCACALPYRSARILLTATRAVLRLPVQRHAGPGVRRLAAAAAWVLPAAVDDARLHGDVGHGHEDGRRLRVVHRCPCVPRRPRLVRRRSQLSRTPTTEPQAGLRRDIRELGVLLGRTLVRQEGQELLDQVEEIRRLIRIGQGRRRRAARGRRAGGGDQAGARVHHLLPPGERGRAGAPRQGARGHPRARRQLALAGGRPHRGGRASRARRWPAEVQRLAVRPVFTAHPTEAARRTVLYKLRQIAELLEGADPRVTARLEETVDLLWQTDELRIAKPDVVDEARNAVWYFDGLHADAVPHVLEELAEELRRLGARAATGRAAARLRQLDRRRPRRQPERRAGEHGARARPPARPWAARRDRRRRRAAPRPLVVGGDRGRHAGAAGVARARPRAAAGGGAALPAPERRGALPAEAHLHPAEAREHARAGSRAGVRASRAATTWAPASCWPSSSWCASRSWRTAES